MASPAQVKEAAKAEAFSLGLTVTPEMKTKDIQEMIDKSKQEKSVPTIFDAPDQVLEPVTTASSTETVQEAAEKLIEPEKAPERDNTPAEAPVVPTTPDSMMVADVAPAQNMTTVLNLAEAGENVTVKKLSEQEKVSIFIPSEPSDLPGSKYQITVNGVKFKIPKDIFVAVPKDVAAIYYSTLEQTNLSARARRNGASSL